MVFMISSFGSCISKISHKVGFVESASMGEDEIEE
jgi:hypothetical protein